MISDDTIHTGAVFSASVSKQKSEDNTIIGTFTISSECLHYGNKPPLPSPGVRKQARLPLKRQHVFVQKTRSISSAVICLIAKKLG
jgi:hypothetical protein